ncbi:MAG: DUF7059 domain-containing protein [Actinomycetota bacterium]
MTSRVGSTLPLSEWNPPRAGHDSQASLAALGRDLAAYTDMSIRHVVGDTALAALNRGDMTPALWRLEHDRTDPLVEPAAALTALWLLGQQVPRKILEMALPQAGVTGAEQLGLVVSAGQQATDMVRGTVQLRPHHIDDATWWLASDLPAHVTGVPVRADHVVGVGAASSTLERWTPRLPVTRMVDVGTGCGVQAFHAAQHTKTVVATDLSTRCLAFASFNAALNAAIDGPFAGRRLDFRQGDLLVPVKKSRLSIWWSVIPRLLLRRNVQTGPFINIAMGLARAIL